MRRIIVTGATSMIGISLINAVIEDPAVEKVYAVVRPNSTKLNRLPNDCRINIIDCDVNNYQNLPSIIGDKCDVFYHLAWPRTSTYQESLKDINAKCLNLSNSIMAVDAAARLGCEKFIGAGGQSEYGPSTRILTPDSPCYPVRADGIAKLASGQLTRLVCEKYGISWIWMRIFSVYGKYDRPNSMIMSTIRKLRNDEHCSFTPCGQQWEFLEADDIGRAFYLAGLKCAGSKIYCVGSGDLRPLSEYIKIIRDEVNPSADLGFGELPYPENPVMYLCADNSTLVQDTGWSPRITFKEGIRRINKYFDKCERIDES